MTEARKKVGRPAVGDVVQVRFPRDLLADIDELAASAGITRSQWIRDAARFRAEAHLGRQRWLAEPIAVRGIRLGTSLGSALVVWGVISVLDRVHRRLGYPPPNVSIDNGTLMVGKNDVLGDLASVRDALWAWDAYPIVTLWSPGGGLIPGSGSVGAARTIQSIRETSSPALAQLRDAIATGDNIISSAQDQGLVADGKVIDKQALLALAHDALQPGAIKHLMRVGEATGVIFNSKVVDKKRFVDEASNLITPNAATRWLESCWALNGTREKEGDPAWIYRPNPVTGAGGNAGRVDFGSLYAAACLELANDPRRADFLLGDLILADATAPLSKLAVSQFLDPGLADAGLANPWWVVFAIEGMSRLSTILEGMPYKVGFSHSWVSRPQSDTGHLDAHVADWWMPQPNTVMPADRMLNLLSSSLQWPSHEHPEITYRRYVLGSAGGVNRAFFDINSPYRMPLGAE